jgi:hypothetical protein
MKKIILILLASIVIPQSAFAAEMTVTEALGVLGKSSKSAITGAVTSVWDATCNAATAVYGATSEAVTDSGIPQTINNNIQAGVSTVQTAASGIKYATIAGVSTAADATWVAASYLARKSLQAGAAGAAVYGTYVLCTAKGRQNLKDIKQTLKPINPVKDLDTPDLICHWNIKNYPTAGHLAALGTNQDQVFDFLVEIAKAVRDGKFNRVNNAGLDGYNGWDLVSQAKTRLLEQVRREKDELKYVLESIRGKHTVTECLSAVQNLRNHPIAQIAMRHQNNQNGIAAAINENQDDAAQDGWLQRVANYTVNPVYAAMAAWWNAPQNHIGSSGIPWKKWIGLEYFLGLKGNAFTFDYADEFINASRQAGARLQGIEEGTPLQTSEMTPEQYLNVDRYMNERAQTSNNKIKFVRGYVYYAQAARLYWNTYKKYHRLQVIESFLNNVDKLPRKPLQPNSQWAYHPQNAVQYHIIR